MRYRFYLIVLMILNFIGLSAQVHAEEENSIKTLRGNLCKESECIKLNYVNGKRSIRFKYKFYQLTNDDVVIHDDNGPEFDQIYRLIQNNKISSHVVKIEFRYDTKGLLNTNSLAKSFKPNAHLHEEHGVFKSYRYFCQNDENYIYPCDESGRLNLLFTDTKYIPKCETPYEPPQYVQLDGTDYTGKVFSYPTDTYRIAVKNIKNIENTPIQRIDGVWLFGEDNLDLTLSSVTKLNAFFEENREKSFQEIEIKGRKTLICVPKSEDQNSGLIFPEQGLPSWGGSSGFVIEEVSEIAN